MSGENFLQPFHNTQWWCETRVTQIVTIIRLLLRPSSWQSSFYRHHNSQHDGLTVAAAMFVTFHRPGYVIRYYFLRITIIQDIGGRQIFNNRFYDIYFYPPYFSVAHNRVQWCQIIERRLQNTGVHGTQISIHSHHRLYRQPMPFLFSNLNMEHVNVQIRHGATRSQTEMLPAMYFGQLSHSGIINAVALNRSNSYNVTIQCREMHIYNQSRHIARQVYNHYVPNNIFENTTFLDNDPQNYVYNQDVDLQSGISYLQSENFYALRLRQRRHLDVASPLVDNIYQEDIDLRQSQDFYTNNHGQSSSYIIANPESNESDHNVHHYL